MRFKSYMILLLVVNVATVIAVLTIPGLSEGLESWLLSFLARNAALPV